MSEETHIHTIVLNTIMTDGQPIDEDEMMEKALGPIEFIDANNEVIATFDDVGWLIEDWKGENGERFRYVPRWRKRQQEEKNDGHNVYPVDDDGDCYICGGSGIVGTTKCWDGDGYQCEEPDFCGCTDEGVVFKHYTEVFE